jgi:hypothetical protein
MVNTAFRYVALSAFVPPAMSASTRHCFALMRGWSGAARCSVHERSVWMLLGNVRVKVPFHQVKSSEMLMALLWSVDDCSVATEFALPVPKKWLEVWVACYCSETKLLSRLEIRDILNCLLVCFAPRTQLQFR